MLVTTANAIERATNDGTVFSVSDLDKGLTSPKMYQALIDEGILERKITVSLEPSYTYHYKVDESYAMYFKREGTGVKIKSNMIETANLVFLQKAISKYSNKSGVDHNETKRGIEKMRNEALAYAIEKQNE